MKKTLLAATAAIALTIAAAGTVAHAADIQEQQVALVHVDISKVTNALRASQLLKTPVRNDNKEKIGAVDDLLISHDDKVPYAVIEVGGFLGLNKKLVLIPFDSITLQQDGKSQILVVPGATKDALKSLPEFKYNK